MKKPEPVPPARGLRNCRTCGKRHHTILYKEWVKSTVFLEIPGEGVYSKDFYYLHYRSWCEKKKEGWTSARAVVQNLGRFSIAKQRTLEELRDGVKKMIEERREK